MFDGIRLITLMNKIEKILTFISVLVTVALVVLTHLVVQAGLSEGEPILSYSAYKQIWFWSIPLVLIGVVLCIKDISKRFSSSSRRNFWYLLFVFTGTVAFPVYFFMHGIKDKKRVDGDGLSTSQV